MSEIARCFVKSGLIDKPVLELQDIVLLLIVELKFFLSFRTQLCTWMYCEL